MIVTLNNGKQHPFEEKALTCGDMVRTLYPHLAGKTVAAKVDGQVTDLRQSIDRDCALEPVTLADPEGLACLRHSASHVLAQAVKRLHPQARLAIGPAIDTGFYYDFDAVRFTEADFPALEAEMAKIIAEDLPIERFELSRREALALMAGEPYKQQLIADLPEDAPLSFYRQGEFVDLCAGPHLMRTGQIKAFKLLSLAGAYWRGDERQPMLQRLYATAYPSRRELDAHLRLVEQAKARDHRKLGLQLDLFSVLPEGPGFPFFHPKGMILRNELEAYWRQLHMAHGYQEVKTPVILDRTLWERSGHWDHYRENMYALKIDEKDYCIKPMSCPGGMLLYGRQIVSYRDLPMRMAELGLVHRNERSGTLHGLMRVRCFTQDDAHIFMTPEQIEQEILGVIDLTCALYESLGFPYQVELSTRPEDSMGSDEDWERATAALVAALDKRGLPYAVNEGDGAFYGPKIDFHIRDCLDRTWQCGTIQLDFQLPERFDLTYIGPDGAKHRPVMLHRVLFGSIERFIAIMTEHFAGAFPPWLAPVQARVMTITDAGDEFAQQVTGQLKQAGIRAESDLSAEKIGFKIRQAQQQKIPYMLVIGAKEAASGQVALRVRGQGMAGDYTPEQIIAMIRRAVEEKIIL